jgi:two-component system sensor histidine kinase ChvG
MRLELRTLRVRAVVVSVLIAVSPLLFVWLGPSVEESTVVEMKGTLYEVAQAAVEDIAENDGVATDGWARHRLEQLAEQNGVWIRVVSADGRVLHGADQGSKTSVSVSFLEQLLTEDPGPPKLVEHEASRPKINQREEFERALDEGRSAMCEYAMQGRLLSCLEVRRLAAVDGGEPKVLYLRNGSVRRMRTIAGVQYPLLKLVVQVLAVSIVLGVWMGWWSVRPVRRLREQVADRARAPVSTEPVAISDRGEIGELADAFNTLLEALEERKKANQAFMADIAHEIKNPVAAIKAAAERLDQAHLGEEGVSRELSAGRAERLAKVLDDSSQRLDGLVSRFLELARAEAGLPDEARQPVELDRIIEALLERFRADVRYAGLVFEADIEPVCIDGAAGHLETTLRNLLENAASFAESTVRVELASDGEQAILSVSDDGPGIAAEDVPHVFDRFFSRRHDQGGTGLGLAMVRAVVEAHRGRIEVSSAEDEGTRFVVYL